MDWLEIAVSTMPGTVEIVAGLFDDMKTGGVVIEDPAVILKYAGSTHPDEWDIPGQVSEDDWPVVKSYLPADQEMPRRLAVFYQALEHLPLELPPRVSVRQVAEEDWANAWRAYYKPVRAGRRLVIKPVWEEWSAQEDDLVVEMDPGMAFGCGTHATTLLCLRLLENYLRSGDIVYDVGTGSGILAVAAAKLGASRVTATELDKQACKVARENVLRNKVEGTVRVVHGNLLEQTAEQADLIVANIIADVIICLAPDAARVLPTGGVFIASGIIRDRAAQVCAVMRAAGLLVREQLCEGHWVALVGEKH